MEFTVKMTKVLFKGSGFWIKYTELLYKWHVHEN